ncbi:D-alanyl-D-alanine carboxypeptidase family protein [Romboutsia lituseburensis]|nr:D-alanyl-D-alanine carboxypeptidase family protein [Romboutsia lituseburensis]
MNRRKSIIILAIIMIAMNFGVVKSNAAEKITYINGVLLVNKQYGLPKDYNPGENREARNAFENMKREAAKNSLQLNAFSTFRNYAYQDRLYNNYVKRDGQAKADKYSARAGHSEHQTGLAFDIGGSNPSLNASQKFANTAEGKWLRDNSYKYGFILRYDKNKEHITGYMYEPWHFRYVGTDLAKKIYNSGLCLEEYLGVYKNGWYQADNTWYYYTENKPVSGWKKSSDKWYYLNTNGQISTGWKKISNKWYYFNIDGDMETGWKKISGQWYYFNADGDMVTDWKKISDKWYYFNTDGDMQIGWKRLSNKWYYFNVDGDMETGWKKISNEWYYFNADGDMITGWKKISNEWYYFNTNGDMVANTVIDGWEIDSNGVATEIINNQ